MSAKISVYLDDSRVFEYEVSDAGKAREHAYLISRDGYRHCEKDCLEFYPAHRISKVKITGNVDSIYPDSVRGT